MCKKASFFLHASVYLQSSWRTKVSTIPFILLTAKTTTFPSFLMKTWLDMKETPMCFTLMGFCY